MLSTIQVGSLSVSTYSVMIGIGALGMLICVLKRRERFNLNRLHCFIFVLLLTICGIAGAKLLYYLENGLQTGGVSFFGSVYLIPIVMPLIGYLFGLRASQTLDVCAPCVAIMVGFIRIGCLLCGCCGGWVMYVGDIYFTWPTQIMESIGDFVICAWLLRIEAQGKKQKVLYPVFMISYSTMRFLIEFLRYKPDKWLNLGHGQWFAVVAIVVAIIWINKNKRQKVTV